MNKWDHNSIKMMQLSNETKEHTEYKQLIQIESGDPYAYFRLQRFGTTYPVSNEFYKQAESEGFHSIVTSGSPAMEKNVAKIEMNEQNRYAVIAFAAAWLENKIDFPLVY
jgi:tRNA(Glu) U13 pseudouridine synthase TruD